MYNDKFDFGIVCELIKNKNVCRIESMNYSMLGWHSRKQVQHWWTLVFLIFLVSLCWKESFLFRIRILPVEWTYVMLIQCDWIFSWSGIWTQIKKETFTSA